MIEILERRLAYIWWRMRCGNGNRDVLIDQLCKTYNLIQQQEHRRCTDIQIRGWEVA